MLCSIQMLEWISSQVHESIAPPPDHHVNILKCWKSHPTLIKLIKKILLKGSVRPHLHFSAFFSLFILLLSFVPNDRNCHFFFSPKKKDFVLMMMQVLCVVVPAKCLCASKNMARTQNDAKLFCIWIIMRLVQVLSCSWKGNERRKGRWKRERGRENWNWKKVCRMIFIHIEWLSLYAKYKWIY